MLTFFKYYGCFEWMHHALSFKAAARERAAAVKEAKKQARRERWEKNQEEKQARIEEIERMQRVSVSLLYLLMKSDKQVGMCVRFNVFSSFSFPLFPTLFVFLF